MLLGGCEARETSPDALDALRAARTPAEHLAGEEQFNAQCAFCHGRLALGTRRGPPLVHPIYEPSHHADEAFHLAVTVGVRAHHWRFGNMPPVSGLARPQVDSIIGYVRWLQRTAGIE
jgi:mono/diheme cytochrome c family protein